MLSFAFYYIYAYYYIAFLIIAYSYILLVTIFAFPYNHRARYTEENAKQIKKNSQLAQCNDMSAFFSVQVLFVRVVKILVFMYVDVAIQQQLYS